MKIHCDSCQKELGDYLYGTGGIEERAHIFGKLAAMSLPDLVCNECWSEGYSETHRKVDTI